MTVDQLIELLVIAVVVFDIVVHRRIEERLRRELLERATAKGKSSSVYTVVVECDPSQALEAIAKVQAAAELAGRSLERLH